MKWLLPLFLTSLLTYAESPAPLINVDKLISEKNNSAFSFFSILTEKKENLLYSPHSLHEIFSLLSLGAKDKTASELELFLKTKINENLKLTYQKIISNLNDPDKPYSIHSANSLWADKSFVIKPDYLTEIKAFFFGTLFSVDFVNETEKSRIEINDWVADKTNKKIKDLLTPGAVSKSTELILINALYFKASWQKPFEKELTSRDIFKIDKKKRVSVPFIKQEGLYPYYSTKQFDFVELKYKGGLVFDIFLPKNNKGLAELEKSFTLELAQNAIRSSNLEKLDIALPRFKFNSYFRLNDALVKAGLDEVFSSKANFTGISDTNGFSIQEAIQKTFISLDEAGTEAAAASAVMLFTGAMDIKPPKVLRANHPFLFMIRDQETDLILFMGRLTDPSV